MTLARPGFVAVGVLGLVLAVLVARVLLGAAGEFDAARQRERAGQVVPAITHYRRALGWYVPLSPYGPRSIAALTRIAEGARARNELGVAVAAERALHAGLSATRSFYQPHAGELSASDARLQAIVKGNTTARPPADPSAALSLLAVAAWLAFVAASFALILRPIAPSGRFLGSPWRALMAMLAALCVLSVSLWLA